MDVQQELAALRAEVAEVRRMQDEGWMDEVRAQEVRAIVTDVLADSSMRTNEVGPIWHSPYGGGQRIVHGDGNWTFLTAVTEQVKFVYANAYGGDSDPADQQTAWGIEQRRLNLIMAGTAIDPSISYLFMIQYDSQPDRWADKPNTFSPVYAWVQKDFGDGWTVMVGNQNIPWDLQTSFLEGCSLTVGDYSIFNYRFGVGRESGVSTQYQGQDLRVRGGVFSQFGQQYDSWDSDETLSAAVSGRAEWKWGSSWDALEVESSFTDSEPSVVLGMSGAWSNGRAQNPASPPTPSAQGVTADVIARISGLNLEAQVAYMRDAAGAPELGWSTGTQFQAALFLTDKLETFVQACWMDTSDVPWIAQAGFNYYFARSRLKFTTKVFVPFGGGNINGIGQLSGGLGMQSASNNASFVAQIQMMW
jgi:hypothetical protein